VDDHVHDCIVVGAGPAGTAALQMARDGLDVVLLERGVRPGDKNVMSGVLLTHILATFVPDYRTRAPLERRITGGYETGILGGGEVLRLPSLRSYRADHLPHAPCTVFRAQFDTWFAQEAEAAGVGLFPETVVEDLIWGEGRAAGVHTRRGDLHARVVIGADGVNSTVAEKPGPLDPPAPDALSLIVREVLDLPAERIEERFSPRPGEGVLCLFLGAVWGVVAFASVVASLADDVAFPRLGDGSSFARNGQRESNGKQQDTDCEGQSQESGQQRSACRASSRGRGIGRRAGR
jgi:electron transfer flavoprotein-quinone oxidoreductase